MSKSVRARRFLLPVGIASLVLVIIPGVLTGVLSFAHWDGLSSPQAAGLDNFRAMFRDPVFRTALWNSLVFAAIAVPLRLGIALGTALLLSPPRRGVGVARTAVALPTFLPDVAYALVWTWLLNPLYGPLAGILRAAGLPGTEWLLTPWGARMGIVLMMLFQIAESFVVILAVRNEIPDELYEVASIEGASRTQTFRRLTLPVLAPVLVLLAARDIAFSLQATFVPALIVTKGGPEYATTFLPLYAYQNAFSFLRFGYAAAMTVTMFVVTAGMIAIQLLTFRRWRRVVGGG